MSSLTQRVWFKAIAVVLVISFITLDITWANPTTPNDTTTLNVPSIFQHLVQSELPAKSLAISGIAKFLLGDKEAGEKPGELKYMQSTMSAEIRRGLDGIDLAHVAVNEKGFVLIPFENERGKFLIQVAAKDNSAAKEMAGYAGAVSDKYIVKVAVKPRATTAPAVKSRNMMMAGKNMSDSWGNAVRGGKIRVPFKRGVDLGGDEIELGVRIGSGGISEYYGSNLTTGQDLRGVVKEERVGEFVVQLNEFRGMRPGVGTKKTLGKQPDMPSHEQKCQFACRDRNNKMSLLVNEPLAEFALNGTLWRAYNNASPFEKDGHFLLVPDIQDPMQIREQEIVEKDILDIVTLSRRSENVLLFFNSRHAGSSVNHIHFQGISYTQPLPIEKARFERAYEQGGVTISRSSDYPAPCILFESDDDAAVSGALWNVVNALQSKKTPFNLVFIGKKVYLFARNIDSEITAEFPTGTLGAMEMAGKIIVVDGATRNTTDAEKIREALKKNCLTEQEMTAMLNGIFMAKPQAPSMAVDDADVSVGHNCRIQAEDSYLTSSTFENGAQVLDVPVGSWVSGVIIRGGASYKPTFADIRGGVMKFDKSNRPTSPVTVEGIEVPSSHSLMDEQRWHNTISKFGWKADSIPVRRIQAGGETLILVHSSYCHPKELLLPIGTFTETRFQMEFSGFKGHKIEVDGTLYLDEAQAFESKAADPESFEKLGCFIVPEKSCERVVVKLKEGGYIVRQSSESTDRKPEAPRAEGESIGGKLYSVEPVALAGSVAALGALTLASISFVSDHPVLTTIIALAVVFGLFKAIVVNTRLSSVFFKRSLARATLLERARILGDLAIAIEHQMEPIESLMKRGNEIAALQKELLDLQEKVNNNSRFLRDPNVEHALNIVLLALSRTPMSYDGTQAFVYKILKGPDLGVQLSEAQALIGSLAVALKIGNGDYSNRVATFKEELAKIDVISRREYLTKAADSADESVFEPARRLFTGLRYAEKIRGTFDKQDDLSKDGAALALHQKDLDEQKRQDDLYYAEILEKFGAIRFSGDQKVRTAMLSFLGSVAMDNLDNSVYLRQAAVTALRKIGGADALELVEKAMQDPDMVCREVRLPHDCSTREAVKRIMAGMSWVLGEDVVREQYPNVKKTIEYLFKKNPKFLKFLKEYPLRLFSVKDKAKMNSIVLGDFKRYWFEAIGLIHFVRSFEGTQAGMQEVARTIEIRSKDSPVDMGLGVELFKNLYLLAGVVRHEYLHYTGILSEGGVLLRQLTYMKAMIAQAAGRMSEADRGACEAEIAAAMHELGVLSLADYFTMPYDDSYLGVLNANILKVYGPDNMTEAQIDAASEEIIASLSQFIARRNRELEAERLLDPSKKLYEPLSEENKAKIRELVKKTRSIRNTLTLDEFHSIMAQEAPAPRQWEDYVAAGGGRVIAEKVDKLRRLGGKTILDNISELAAEIDILTAAIKRNPNDAEAYYKRAVAYGTMGRYDLAMPDHDNAIRLAPNNGNIRFARGISYVRSGNRWQAKVDMLKTIELDPAARDNIVAAAGRLGVDLAQASKEFTMYVGKIEQLSAAIKKDPKNAELYNERGINYAQMGEHEKAMADLAKAISLKPSDPRMYTNRASVYVDMRQYQPAIDDCGRAIKLDPTHYNAYIYRGHSFAATKMMNEAAADFAFMIKAYPEREAEIRKMAEILKVDLGLAPHLSVDPFTAGAGIATLATTFDSIDNSAVWLVLIISGAMGAFIVFDLWRTRQQRLEMGTYNRLAQKMIEQGAKTVMERLTIIRKDLPRSMDRIRLALAAAISMSDAPNGAWENIYAARKDMGLSIEDLEIVRLGLFGPGTAAKKSEQPTALHDFNARSGYRAAAVTGVLSFVGMLGSAAYCLAQGDVTVLAVTAFLAGAYFSWAARRYFALGNAVVDAYKITGISGPDVPNRAIAQRLNSQDIVTDKEAFKNLSYQAQALILWHEAFKNHIIGMLALLPMISSLRYSPPESGKLDGVPGATQKPEAPSMEGKGSAGMDQQTSFDGLLKEITAEDGALNALLSLAEHAMERRANHETGDDLAEVDKAFNEAILLESNGKLLERLKATLESRSKLTVQKKMTNDYLYAEPYIRQIAIRIRAIKARQEEQAREGLGADMTPSPKFLAAISLVKSYAKMAKDFLAVTDYPNQDGLAKIEKGYEPVKDNRRKPARTDIFATSFDLPKGALSDTLERLTDEVIRALPADAVYDKMDPSTYHVSAVPIQDLPFDDPKNKLTPAERKAAEETVARIAENQMPYSLKFIGLRFGTDGGVIAVFEDEALQTKSLRGEIITECNKVCANKVSLARKKPFVSITLMRIFSRVEGADLDALKAKAEELRDLSSLGLSMEFKTLNFYHETRWMHTEFDYNATYDLGVSKAATGKPEAPSMAAPQERHLGTAVIGMLYGVFNRKGLKALVNAYEKHNAYSGSDSAAITEVREIIKQNRYVFNMLEHVLSELGMQIEYYEDDLPNIEAIGGVATLRKTLQLARKPEAPSMAARSVRDIVRRKQEEVDRASGVMSDEDAAQAVRDVERAQKAARKPEAPSMAAEKPRVSPSGMAPRTDEGALTVIALSDVLQEGPFDVSEYRRQYRAVVARYPRLEFESTISYSTALRNLQVLTGKGILRPTSSKRNVFEINPKNGAAAIRAKKEVYDEMAENLFGADKKAPRGSLGDEVINIEGKRKKEMLSLYAKAARISEREVLDAIKMFKVFEFEDGIFFIQGGRYASVDSILTIDEGGRTRLYGPSADIAQIAATRKIARSRQKKIVDISQNDTLTDTADDAQKPEAPNMAAEKPRVSPSGMAPQTQAVTELFEIVENTINNERARVVHTGNRLMEHLSQGPITDPLRFEDPAAEIKDRVGQMVKEVMSAPVSWDDEGAKEMALELKASLGQLEADSIVGSLIILARRAKFQNQKLIIGLETDWIPGYDKKGSMQKNAMTSLVREIGSLDTTLRSMGLENVVILHKSKDELARAVSDEATRTNTKLTNVVLFGSNETLNSEAFNGLRSTLTEARAFMAVVDPSELNAFYDEHGNSMADQLKIRLMEMLCIALELAVGKDLPKIPMKADYDKALRIVTFLPKVEPMDYDELKRYYNAAQKALQAA